MVIMELTLEAAQASFPDLSALPYAVTLFQFSFCFLLPVCISKGETLKDLPTSFTAVVPYVSLSLIVFGSTGLATMSIRYVSYPTKVIFKSTKLVPTMFVATMLQGQRYSTIDYLSAFLLCAGAAGFGFGESTNTSDDKPSSTYGIILLLISICCDSFTPNIQQRLMGTPPSHATYQHGSTPSIPINARSWKGFFHQLSHLILPPGGTGVTASVLMTNANAVGCIGVFMYMSLSGLLADAAGVAVTNPRLAGYLTLIGVSLSTAVFAYTRLIKEAGSVVAVGVATLRKVVTVVLSYIFFPKRFSRLHFLSSLLVLSGILLSSYAKQKKTRSETGR
jgi:adenosine 3'-phospho 5'-phosphosulfate transporter B3